MIYKPDKWVIMRIGDTPYKVFGTWTGGYLDSDQWRLNSGIVHVTDKERYYLFHGESGSVYQCYKNSYGTTAYGLGIITEWLKYPLVKLLDDCDWEERINERD